VDTKGDTRIVGLSEVTFGPDLRRVGLRVEISLLIPCSLPVILCDWERLVHANSASVCVYSAWDRDRE
jgi:hypothetical protein